MKIVALTIALALATVANSRDAHACTIDTRPEARVSTAPDVFTWFEAADAVAEMVVTKTPGFTTHGDGIEGDVTFTLRKALKGKPGKTVAFKQPWTRCNGLGRNQVVLVFVDAKGAVIGIGARTTKASLEQWKKAATPADQRALLEKLAKSKVPAIGGAATKKLATLQPAP